METCLTMSHKVLQIPNTVLLFKIHSVPERLFLKHSLLEIHVLLLKKVLVEQKHSLLFENKKLLKLALHYKKNKKRIQII